MERLLGRILLEQSNMGVMVLDQGSRVLLWNEWLVHYSGLSPEQALGRRLDELFPDLPDRTSTALTQVLTSGLPRILSPIVFPYYFPFREKIRQFIRIIPLFREDAPGHDLVVLIQDLTAQLEYEEILEERFRLMLDGMKEHALILTDHQGRITHWDTRAEGIFGYKAAEVIQRPVAVLFPEEDGKSAEAEIPFGVAAGTSRWEGRVSLSRKGGDPFGAYMVSTALKDPKGTPRGFSIMVRDISEHLQAQKALWDSLAKRRELEAERERTLERLKQAMNAAVQVISQIVELRDPYTAGHQQRVSILACSMAEEMALSAERVEGIRMAGIIHDLGKISIPAEILVKPSRLNDLEYRLIQAHPEAGYQILKPIEFPWPMDEMVLQHHERMDGSGYPQGLKGEDILLEARVLAVADVVEAMASHRPYRPALGIEAALAEIEGKKGILYDSDVVEACLRLFRKKGFRFEDLGEIP